MDQNLIQMLVDPLTNVDIRRIALKQLMITPSLEIIKKVVGIVRNHDCDSSLSQTALLELGKVLCVLETPTDIKIAVRFELALIARDEQRPDLQVIALRTLAPLGAHEVSETITSFLGDNGNAPMDLHEVLELLQYYPEYSALARPFLSHRNAKVVRAAMLSLAEDHESIEARVNLASKSTTTPTVRVAAINSINDSSPQLINALQNINQNELEADFIRNTAIEAVRNLEAKNVIHAKPVGDCNFELS